MKGRFKATAAALGNDKKEAEPLTIPEEIKQNEKFAKILKDADTIDLIRAFVNAMTSKKEQLATSQPMTLDEPEDDADSQKAFADELLKVFPSSGEKAREFAESLRNSGLVIKKARDGKVMRDKSMPCHKDGGRTHKDEINQGESDDPLNIFKVQGSPSAESLSQTQTQKTAAGTDEPGKSGG